MPTPAMERLTRMRDFADVELLYYADPHRACNNWAALAQMAIVANRLDTLIARQAENDAIHHAEESNNHG